MLFFWLILLQLVLFGVLVGFLKMVLTRNISKATTQLHTLNADYTQKLEEARKQHAEAEKYYDDMILKAKVDVERNKVQILKEAQQAAEQLVSDSRAQSEQIIEQAKNARETILNEAEEHIRQRASVRAGEALMQVLPSEIGEPLHRQWVDALLKNGLDELGRLRVDEGVKHAEVVSAYPLTHEIKSALEKIVAQRVGSKLPLSENVDASLLAGLKITIGSVVIDGSLRSKIREALRDA